LFEDKYYIFNLSEICYLFKSIEKIKVLLLSNEALSAIAGMGKGFGLNRKARKLKRRIKI